MIAVASALERATLAIVLSLMFRIRIAPRISKFLSCPKFQVKTVDIMLSLQVASELTEMFMVRMFGLFAVTM